MVKASQLVPLAAVINRLASAATTQVSSTGSKFRYKRIIDLDLRQPFAQTLTLAALASIYH